MLQVHEAEADDAGGSGRARQRGDGGRLSDLDPGLRLGSAGREAGAFLVEGRRAIDGLLAAGWQPRRLCLRQGEAIPPGWPPATVLGERAAKRASAATTPSGYLASFPIPEHGEPEAGGGGLVLAGVGDPGNLGTLIRTAAAFAVGQVLCLGGADPYGPKAVQASAGAIAAVRLFRRDAAEGLAGARLAALVPRGGVAPSALAPGQRWLVVGGEADGIPGELLGRCGERVTLPMPGAVVSVAVAVGEEVSAGQKLLTLEAMKMETTLYAERAGKIAEVLVRPGVNVDGGDLVIRFE